MSRFLIISLIYISLFTALSNVSFATDLEGIYFSDPKNGWIVGDNGKIFHTADGGTS